MAYTYKGPGFYKPSATESYWNGSAWSAPNISFGRFETMGNRQGVDPVASGHWDRKTFRLNPVQITRQTGYQSPLTILFQPVHNWGINYTGEPNSFRYDPNYVANKPPGATWSDNTANYVANKVLAALHDPDFQGLTESAELKETLQMLRSPLKTLRRFLMRNLYRRRGESAREFFGRLSDVSSDTWMEYRYGVMPIIYTIEELVKLLREGLPGIDTERIYRKSRSSVYSRSSRSKDRVLFSSFDGQRLAIRTLDAKYTGKIYFRYTRIPDLYEQLGMDFWSLPSTAWELTRLSFVWDWFLGIGDFIQALQAEREREIYGIGVSLKTVERHDVSLYPGSLKVAGTNWYPPDTYSSSIYTFKSETLERRVIPHTGIKLPALKPDALDFYQYLDSLALLWQNLPKTKVR